MQAEMREDQMKSSKETERSRDTTIQSDAHVTHCKVKPEIRIAGKTESMNV